MTALFSSRTFADVLFFSYSPMGHNVHCAIFSNATPNVVFATSRLETFSLDISVGAVRKFEGGPVNHSCHGNVMALDDAGMHLYVGYRKAKCIVAYNVSTHQQIWTTSFPSAITSLSCHTEVLIVAVKNSHFTTLSTADGTILQALDIMPKRGAFSHAVISGTTTLYVCQVTCFSLIRILVLVLMILTIHYYFLF
jgi:hypothetical protein